MGIHAILIRRYMDVTVTKLSPGTLNALRALASENGKTLEEYARLVLERASENHSKDRSDKAKWLRSFEDWVNGLDRDVPTLTDHQISRESIYEEQINRQL